MRLTVLIFTFLCGLTTQAMALSQDQLKAISAFVKDAPAQVKAEIALPLFQGLLGYKSTNRLDLCDLSEDAKDFIYTKKDELHKLPLTHINLTDLGLKKVPHEVFAIAGLTELVLDQNQLKTLPSSLDLATSLQVLSLHENLFSELPQSIAALPCLVYLDVSDNVLLELPNALFQHDLESREIYADENGLEFEDLTGLQQMVATDTDAWLGKKTIKVHSPAKTKRVLMTDEDGKRREVEVTIEDAEIILKRVSCPRSDELDKPKTLLYLYPHD